MKHIRTWLLASAIGLGATCMVCAQPGGGMGQGTGPMGSGPAASAAGTGTGTGMGTGLGPGGGRRAARMGANTTPGWSLMTPQERTAHREHVRTMKTYDECKVYVAQHHEAMVARAKERGAKMLPQPRRDPCAGLKN